MKGKEKNQLKSQKGITLIALVITIIILLILAGVTINIVIHNGIIEKSQTAVDKYSKEQVKESLNLAILNYQFSKHTEGEKKTFEDVIAEIGGTATHNEADKTYTVILDGYEFTIDDSTFEIKESKDEETSGETETPVTPEVTEYTITVEENENVTVTGGGKVEKGQSATISATIASGYVFNKWTITSGTGTIADEKSASTTVIPTSNITIKAIVEEKAEYDIGDEVTVGGESFYVLEKIYETDDTVTLITKYPLIKTGKIQCTLEQAQADEGKCAFSSRDYWTETRTDFDSALNGSAYDINDIATSVSTDAINKAKTYATSKGAISGRLLTYEEAIKLQSKISSDTTGKISKMLWAKFPIYGGYTYWLGSIPYSSVETVYGVSGMSEDYVSWNCDEERYTVRPVIVISKSLIS